MADTARVGDPTTQSAAWAEEERTLRRREVTNAGRGVRAQMVISVAALAATAIAGFAAWQAAEAVDQAASSTERQADEARLSTAVASLGADRSAERIAGLTLLGDHVESTISDATSDEDAREASRLYTVALDITENYLRHPPDPQAGAETGTGSDGASPRDANVGPSSDSLYAASEFKQLLDMRPQLEALGEDSAPEVDLSNVELDGLTSWAGGDDQPGIDFSWLEGHYFYGIDLRGGNLKHSVWGVTVDNDGILEGSSLRAAHLQCTDLTRAKLVEVNLTDADLRGADLSNADLRGANLTNADLRNANLNGVNLNNADLTNAQLAGAVANGVTREGALGVNAAVGVGDLWTRSDPAPVGVWRGKPNIPDCVAEYPDRQPT